MEELNLLKKAKLTDRQISCLALYYFDGLGQKDIADRMGLKSHSTVNQHIKSGLKKLEALGMTPSRKEFEHTPRIITMDPAQMDKLGPEDIVARW